MSSVRKSDLRQFITTVGFVDYWWEIVISACLLGSLYAIKLSNQRKSHSKNAREITSQPLPLSQH